MRKRRLYGYSLTFSVFFATFSRILTNLREAMPAESVHHRMQDRKYTIVILPATESETPRTINVGKIGLLAACCGVVILIAVLVLGTLVYTPLGIYVPIPNPELESRYQNQIAAIREQLTQLTDDVIVLREYNLRLRKALGEKISPDDSAFIAQLSIQGVERRRTPAPAQENREMGRQFESSGLRPDIAQVTTPVMKSVNIELPLTLPVRGYMTQEFNPEQQHFGIDFAGREGTSIFAAADGNIVFADWTYDDGYMIILAHSEGYRTAYKHNQALLKGLGQFVRRGESIALLGNSGKTSYGPHLHFEVWKDGIPQNPKEFLLALQ